MPTCAICGSVACLFEGRGFTQTGIRVHGLKESDTLGVYCFDCFFDETIQKRILDDSRTKKL